MGTPTPTTCIILIIGAVVVNYCIYAPILTYFLNKFYSLRKSLVFEKRCGGIVCASNIVALLILLISRPLQMLGATATISAFMPHKTVSTLILIINDILYSYLYSAFIYLVIWRFYILFFRLNWKKASLNSQWKQHLSQDIGHDIITISSLDFFLRNKSTLGSKRKSGKFFLVIYLIHASLICSAYIYESIWDPIDINISITHRTLSFFIEIASWVPPFIVAVLLWKACPTYYDYFFVRNEMKWLCIVYALDIICSLLIYVSKTEFLQQTFIVYIRSATLLMMVLTTTFYVWFKNETEIVSESDVGESGPRNNLGMHRNRSQQHLVIRALTPFRSQHTISAFNQEHDRNRNTTQLIDVLHKINSFEIFMQHLVNEYSMENLLSVTEFIQFKLQLLMDVNFMKQIENFENDNKQCIDEFITANLLDKKAKKLKLEEKENDDINALELDIVEISPEIFQDALIKYGMKPQHEFENDNDNNNNNDDNEDDIQPLIDDDDECLDLISTLKSNLQIRDRRYHINTYKACFIAREMVSYLMDTGLAENERKAVEIGQKMVNKKLIKHVTKPHEFKNEYLLFRFNKDPNDEFEPIPDDYVWTLELEVAERLYGLLDIADRKWHLRKYKACFIGKEAYQVMINADLATDESDAKKLGNRLIKKKIIEHVEKKHKTFENEYYFYRFIHPKYAAISINGHNNNDLSTVWHKGSNTDDMMDENKEEEDTQKKVKQQKLRTNARKLKPNLDIMDRKWRLKKYKACFVGSEATPIIMDLFGYTEHEAVTFCNELIAAKIIEHVEQDHSFISGNYYYRYTEDVPDREATISTDSHTFGIGTMTKTLTGTDTGTPNSTHSTYDDEEMAELQERGRNLKENIEIRDRKYHLKTYKKCFVGNQCVKTIISLQYASDEKEAIKIGNQLINAAIIRHVTNEHRFENKYYFYKFVSDIQEEEANNDTEESALTAITKQISNYSPLLMPINKIEIKPQLFLTLGYNQYTKIMYDKYNLLEIPPSIPRSAIVWGSDQFQYQLNHHFASQDTAKSNTDSLGISLPSPLPSASTNKFSDIPTSSELFARKQREILITNKRKEDYTIIIKQLYNKYISPSSEHQVNISYHTRTVLTALITKQNINELNEKDIFGIFDQSIKEILNLMSDSFSRFKKTTAFYKIKSGVNYTPISDNTPISPSGTNDGFPNTD